MNWADLEAQYGAQLKRDFANVFGDLTPNPKGAKPSREALDERRGAEEIPARPPASTAIENLSLVVGGVGGFFVALGQGVIP